MWYLTHTGEIYCRRCPIPTSALVLRGEPIAVEAGEEVRPSLLNLVCTQPGARAAEP